MLQTACSDWFVRPNEWFASSGEPLRHTVFSTFVCHSLRGYNFRAHLEQGRNERRQPETRMIAKSASASDAKTQQDLLAQSISRVALQRDRAAFELLFRHFAPRVKTYCMRLGADASIAEEITQETMVSVWSNATQFDRRKANVSTWIFTIARNLSIDRFRKSRRPQFDPCDPAFVPDDAERPDAILEQGENEERLRDILQTLSTAERDVLMLSFYRHFSHGEIAKQLDVPLGTVKSRTRLAFAKIRSAIGTRDQANSK